MVIQSFLPVFVPITIFVLLYAVILPNTINYKIENKKIKITLFNIFDVESIDIEQIQSIRVCSFWDKDLISLNFKIKRIANRICNRGVAIKVQRGMFELFIITPPNPVEFIAKVKNQAPHLDLET